MPDPSCLKKKISVRKIKAELFKQYFMSSKEVVWKYRGQIEMNAIAKTPVTQTVFI